MLSKEKNNNSGFTIIEVLIVLAIAGLIMLIVFLAVPALQRSARNTSRKSDASALLAGISEYTDNNNGTLPAALSTAITNNQMQFCSVAACNGGDAPSSVKVGYYTKIGGGGTGSINLVNGVDDPATAVDEVLLEVGVTCNGNTPSALGAGARSVAALYGIETGGSSLVWQCVAS